MKRSCKFGCVRRAHSDEARLRAIELDENVERSDLDSYEVSKEQLAAVRQVEAAAKAKVQAEAAAAAAATHRATGRPRGRRAQAASKRQVAEETGISRRERERDELHVALADAFPFMQRSENGW